MPQTAAQRLLRKDPRTAKAAAHESVALPANGAEALLRVLRPGEAVLALYHQGMTGHAALTTDALILLGGTSAQRVTRVPRPLAVLRPTHGVRDSVDVSVEGRRVGLWGSELDKKGDLLLRAGKPVPDPLAEDPRTASAAAAESVSFSDGQRKALLEALGPDEAVRSFYREGWNRAALTENGLVLIRGLTTPTAVRVPGPLRILRRAYGASGSVELLIHGRPHKLNGSELDPKGELLEAMGDLLPPDSSLRPGRGTRFSAWVGRHPVLVCAVVIAVFFTGLGAAVGMGSGSEQEERAEAVAVGRPEATRTLAVPSYHGAHLTTAAARARSHPWRTVSAADASSARRPVKTTDTGWRVCFQRPSHGETVHPSGTALTLYAVPEQEECPRWLGGPGRAVMPDLVGEQFDDASRALGDLGLDNLTPFHAHTGKRLDGGSRDLAEWQVCRQRPEPDTGVSTTMWVELWLIDPGGPCTEPSPAPTPEPRPKPKPEPRPRPSYGTTTEDSTGGSGTGGGGTGGGAAGGGPSSSPGGGTGSRAGARFGQYCSPVGATATTADGRPAKCFMGKDGRARWGYDSG